MAQINISWVFPFTQKTHMLFYVMYTNKCTQVWKLVKITSSFCKQNVWYIFLVFLPNLYIFADQFQTLGPIFAKIINDRPGMWRMIDHAFGSTQVSKSRNLKRGVVYSRYLSGTTVGCVNSGRGYGVTMTTGQINLKLDTIKKLRTNYLWME